MVDRNLLREFDISDDELTSLITAEDGSNSLDHFMGEGQNFDIGRIVSGKVVELVGDQVVVDGTDRLVDGATVRVRKAGELEAGAAADAAVLANRGRGGRGGKKGDFKKGGFKKGGGDQQ